MSELIVGDVHLGASLSLGKPGLGNVLNSRVVDQVKLLDWVADTAIEKGTDNIILTGDICEDVRPEYILIELLVGFFKKCDSYNIDVHIVGGNHDLQRTGNKYTSYLDLISSFELPNVHIYKNMATIFIGDTGYTFMPFRDMRSLECETSQEGLDKLSAMLKYELVSIPLNFNKVIVGHLAIEDSIYLGGEIDETANELMCPVSMFEGYDFVFMGHVHFPQEMNAEDPYVAHVGSLDTSDWGEINHSKVVIKFDADKHSKFEEIIVPTRPMRSILINVPANVDATTYVLKQIKAVHKTKSLKRAIVKVEIKLLDENSDGVDKSDIKNETYNLGAFHTILYESKTIAPIIPTTQTVESSDISTKEAVKVWVDGENFESDKEKLDLTNAFNDLILELEIEK